MNKSKTVGAAGTVRIKGKLLLRNGTPEDAALHAMTNIETRDIVSIGQNAHGWAAWTTRGVWVGYCATREHAYNLCRAFLRLRADSADHGGGE